MTSATGIPIAPRPCSPAEAVERARRLVGIAMPYVYGTGNYDAHAAAADLLDVPWTARESDGAIGCDCAGLIVWAFRVPRHRPGLNKGGAYDVEDDINTNSMLGDAAGAQDLFSLAVDVPQPGDVIAYPTFRLPGVDRPFIGHTALVVGVDRALLVPWDMSAPRFSDLDIIQVAGGDGRKPAAVATDGSLFDHHNTRWPKPEHRAFLLRIVA